MSASFWKLFGIGVVSAIDNLLNKEDVTLEQLFLEDELLNECKYGNKSLLTFVLRPSSLESLFQFLVTPIPESADPKTQRFPHIASEILCTEGFWEHLSHPLFEENPQLITHLWSYFLAEEVTRNNISAVSKVASTFFERLPLKSFELLPKDNIIDALLSLCEHNSVVELLLKIDIASQAPENAPLKEWLESTALLTKLLRKLDSRSTPAIICETVSEALQEQLVRPDALQMIDRLQSPEHFSIILELVLQPDSQISDLLPVISLIITLLRHDALENYDSDHTLADIDPYISQLLSGTPRFTELLAAPTFPAAFTLAHGLEISPVGGAKLKVIELLHTLVSLRKKVVITHLIENGLITTCFDLFFAQPWNNFLHKFVLDIVLSIISNKDLATLLSLLQVTGLLDKIGQTAQNNEDDLAGPKHIQRGHMGHIAAMIEALLAEAHQSSELLDLLQLNQSFVLYLNRTLYATQRRQFCWQTLSGLPEKYILFHSEFQSSIPAPLLNPELLIEPTVTFATDEHLDHDHDSFDQDEHGRFPDDNSNSDSNSSGDEDDSIPQYDNNSSDEDVGHDVDQHQEENTEYSPPPTDIVDLEEDAPQNEVPTITVDAVDVVEAVEAVVEVVDDASN